MPPLQSKEMTDFMSKNEKNTKFFQLFSENWGHLYIPLGETRLHLKFQPSNSNQIREITDFDKFYFSVIWGILARMSMLQWSGQVEQKPKSVCTCRQSIYRSQNP